ncbi:MAG: copper amine oxidase N-terminal domain-containing protein [Bacillota bacterium]
MRKLITLLVMLTTLAAAGLVPAFAFPSHQAKFVIGRASYEADGVSKQMDAAPFIANNRTYVPVRYLALALGVAEKDILWDGKTRTVTLKLDNVTLKLTIGSKTLYVNGQAERMDVAPVIKKGRTYLPARWVAEAFGYEVAWDAGTKTVLVYPPGQVVKPEPQPVGYKIDWDAAWNGTLQPPANAIAPPDGWGFPAKAVRMEFKVGSRYAKVTRADGSAYTLDLGVPCVVAGNPVGVEFLKKQYPSIYNSTNSIPLLGADYGALYVPFIPVAEAFGVPRENIVWDGQHLAVFGYYGDARNYRVLTPGTKESVCRVVGNNPEVASGSLDFPLFVKDGVLMVGINSVSDVSGMLFSVAGGSVPGLINAYDDIYFGGWEYESGTAGASCEPRA